MSGILLNKEAKFSKNGTSDHAAPLAQPGTTRGNGEGRNRTGDPTIFRDAAIHCQDKQNPCKSQESGIDGIAVNTRGCWWLCDVRGPTTSH
jgi:hypothetical protein